MILFYFNIKFIKLRNLPANHDKKNTYLFINDNINSANKLKDIIIIR